MAEHSNPLSAPTPAEVPLPDAPLVRVIAQVRFPPILALEERTFAASFQDATRTVYPLVRQEQIQNLMLNSSGVTPVQRQSAWRFSDVDDEWRVSVGTGFIAIETTCYKSRDDFIERLRFVLDTFSEHVKPVFMQRLGVRYIDRVTGDALAKIGNLVQPEVLGIMGTRNPEHVQHSFTETLFTLPGLKEQLLARWAWLPAGATLDRNAIEPVDEPSWLLDLDLFSNERQEFMSEVITAAVRRYAERIYTMFRWVVTDEFLREYGGTP